MTVNHIYRLPILATLMLTPLYLGAQSDGNWTTLARLIDTRLSHMRDVAAYKWINKIAIEDKEREALVLNSSQTKARSCGLDTTATLRLFERQIHLAKYLQQSWFDQWAESKPQTLQYPDLAEVIRPALLKLGDEIIGSLCQLTHQPTLNKRQINQQKKSFLAALSNARISKKDKRRLFRLIRQVSHSR